MDTNLYQGSFRMLPYNDICEHKTKQFIFSNNNFEFIL